MSLLISNISHFYGFFFVTKVTFFSINNRFSFCSTLSINNRSFIELWLVLDPIPIGAPAVVGPNAYWDTCCVRPHFCRNKYVFTGHLLHHGLAVFCLVEHGLRLHEERRKLHRGSHMPRRLLTEHRLVSEHISNRRTHSPLQIPAATESTSISAPVRVSELHLSCKNADDSNKNRHNIKPMEETPNCREETV